MASYPTSVKTFTTKSDGAGNKVQAEHVNSLQDEVTAIEDGLLNGTAPLNSSRITAPSAQITNSTLSSATIGVLTVSSGVTFTGSTSPLTYYQQGTWTPSVSGSSAGSPTYTAREGAYVRVGKIVHVWARVILASTGGMDGQLQVTGLPFLASVSVAAQPVSLTWQSAGSSYAGVFAYVNGGNSNILFSAYLSTGFATFAPAMPSSLIGNDFGVSISGAYLST